MKGDACAGRHRKRIRAIADGQTNFYIIAIGSTTPPKQTAQSYPIDQTTIFHQPIPLNNQLRIAWNNKPRMRSSRTHRR
jgi:hypothetical protein